MSHRTYMQLITPIKRIKYRKAMLPRTSQKRTMSPEKNKIRNQATQLFRPHQSVIKKNPAMPRQAILDANTSKPQTMRAAPMNDDPR